LTANDPATNKKMHELSIAMSMVEIAAGELEKHDGGRVGALYLKLGALSGVVKEALLFSWEIACRDTPLSGARLEIEEIPVVVFCARCAAKKQLAAINSFICPVCRSATPEILQGRELEVTALEII
jgi:hydrogenase nickel incorporation protein HypA/HybF